MSDFHSGTLFELLIRYQCVCGADARFSIMSLWTMRTRHLCESCYDAVQAAPRDPGGD